MKKNMILALFTVLCMVTLQSCQEEKTDDTARVQLRLVDASGDYEEVNVEIIDIQYKSSENESWISFTPEKGYPIKVDLTELIAGNDLLLSDEIIPAGMINQIRLVLGENNMLLLKNAAEPIVLDTPSAQQSGLKLKLDTELEAGFSYTFILDWDVHKSIIKAGNSDKYILKPVIRVNTSVNSGSIKGIVTGESMAVENSEPQPLGDVKVAVYTSENEYITQTTTDEKGAFLIQGLQPGKYMIMIDELKYQPFTSELIEVEAGMVKDAGSILLKIPVN
jgi:hypothetical protein